jgi:nicotinamidase-related amidase
MTRTLLVIDIQNDYFTGGVLPLWEAKEAEARILIAMHRARARSDRIVLVRHLSSETSGLFAAESLGCAIRPAIIEAAGDAPIITKHFADAFQGTDLLDHISGTDELLVCGMMTQNCVVFTAMSGLVHGFNVKIIGDLCAAPSKIVHRVALSALRSKMQVTDFNKM